MFLKLSEFLLTDWLGYDTTSMHANRQSGITINPQYPEADLNKSMKTGAMVTTG